MQPSNEEIAAGHAFGRLVAIMRLLRSAEGCPWDREQTLQTLRPFLLEETYEVLEAIDREDRDALKVELGDLAFEIVFLAQIASEERAFTVADAIESVIAKLVRRHPHVFPTDAAGTKALPRTGDQVVQRWEQLKLEERAASGEPRRLLSGIPRTLPALLRASEIGSRVATVGFDWSAAADVVDKIEEEVRELRDAVEAGTAEGAEEELGDLLFAIANVARKLGVEPESALRAANDKFTRRFGELERRFEASGRSLDEAGLEALEREWAIVKAEER